MALTAPFSWNLHYSTALDYVEIHYTEFYINLSTTMKNTGRIFYAIKYSMTATEPILTELTQSQELLQNIEHRISWISYNRY
jgi:hypothetical protein